MSNQSLTAGLTLKKEDFYSNSTSWNSCSGFSNITSEHDIHGHISITPENYDFCYYSFDFHDNSSDDQTV